MGHRAVSVLSLLTVMSMLLAACGAGAAAGTPAAATATVATQATAAATAPAAGGAATATTSTATTPTAAASTAATATTPTAAATATTAAAGGAATATVVPTAAPTPTAATAPMASGLKSAQQAALDAAGGKKLGGTVSILATWGGTEQDDFMAMLKPFEDATGVKVQYTGTRDLNAVLTTRVQGGNPPDLAGLPGPAQMAQFAQQGKLQDLSTVIDMSTYQQQYAKTWQDLGTVNGKLVAIFMKTSVKGLIWYDPKAFAAKGYTVPKTWDELVALTQKITADGGTPWCEALGSGAASGWPGTDWLEDIVLRQDGAQFYNDWWAGKVSWTDPKMVQAWQTWGQIVANPKNIYGGANTVLSTNFGNVGDPLFKSPPGCYMVHQASFITTFFEQDTPGVKAGVDYDFFPFPPINSSQPSSTEMAGDLFGMFNNTPQAAALIKYLTTPEAQAIWASRGGAISPNKNVPQSVYPDDLTRREASLLLSAQVAVFDASDQMPDAMQTAFYKGILQYIQTPSSLNSVLSGLDSTRKDAYGQ